MSFDELKDEIQKQFPTNKIIITHPYKLCDFKPLYGAILYKYIKDYDFWGFCDCDAIFGDIRKMISEDVLERYNHILTLGHLQLQRVNDECYSEILKNVKAKGKYNLEYVISHEENFCFDELPHGVPLSYYKLYPDKIYIEWLPDGRPLYDELTPNYSQFVDMYNDKEYLGKFYYLYHFYGKHEHIVPFWHRTTEKKSLRRMLHFKYINGSLYRCYWKNWCYHQEEILYCHLYKRKMQIATSNFNQYLILPHKFKELGLNKFQIWKETRGRFLGKIRLYGRRELKRIYYQMRKKVNIQK